MRVYDNIPGSEFGNGKGPDRRFGAMDVRDINGMVGRTRTVTLATFSLIQMTQTIDGQTARMDGFGVSSNLFAMLGVKAGIGRTITEEDGSDDRDHIVLGYDAWIAKRRHNISSTFGACRSIRLTGCRHSSRSVSITHQRRPRRRGRRRTVVRQMDPTAFGRRRWSRQRITP